MADSTGIWRNQLSKMQSNVNQNQQLLNALAAAIPNNMGNPMNNNQLYSNSINMIFPSMQPTVATPISVNSLSNQSISNHNMSGNPLNPPPTATQPGMQRKRGHVSKACTNCRKMHAGCDKERPCARCVFNGWEATCVDTPRKKRISKKVKPGEKSEIIKIEGNNSSSEKQDNFDKIWSTPTFEALSQDIFNELYNNMSTGNRSSEVSSPEPPSQEDNTNSPINFLPENLLLTASDVMKPSPKNCSSSIKRPMLQGMNSMSVEITQMPAPVPQSNNPGFITRKEATLMVKEIGDLRDKNRNLESKLDSVTQELSDLKERHMQLVQIVSTLLIPQKISMINPVENTPSNM